MLQSLVPLLKTEENPVKYFILAGPSILLIVSEPTVMASPKSTLKSPVGTGSTAVAPLALGEGGRYPSCHSHSTAAVRWLVPNVAAQIVEVSKQTTTTANTIHRDFIGSGPIWAGIDAEEWLAEVENSPPAAELAAK